VWEAGTHAWKELLAIKDALKKWRRYIENELPFTVITDHGSLTYMNTVRRLSKILARWNSSRIISLSNRVPEYRQLSRTLLVEGPILRY